MQKQLSAARAKDRELMANAVEAVMRLCPGGSVDRPDPLGERSVAVSFRCPHGLAVTVEFDGDSPQDRKGEFCMAWHVSVNSDMAYSEAFGAAMGASVNQYHHRKCTAFAYGFQDLCEKLVKAVTMISDGTAYRD